MIPGIFTTAAARMRLLLERCQWVTANNKFNKFMKYLLMLLIICYMLMKNYPG